MNKNSAQAALILTGIFALAISSGNVSADEICKEIDSKGNPSFVNCDAAGKTARQVEIRETNVVLPEEYMVELPEMEEPDSNEKASKDASRADKKGREAQLVQAERELEDARQIREGDRQGTKTGSRPTESYLERIKKAEQKVESLK